MARRGHYTALERKDRIETLIAKIRANQDDDQFSLKQFRADMCLELGISDRKVKEYIQILEFSGKIYVDKKKDWVRIVMPRPNIPKPVDKPISKEQAESEVDDIFSGVSNG